MDTIKLELQVFTETTIRESGWYWFVPLFTYTLNKPRFVQVDQGTIKDGDLNTHFGAGYYIGPFDLPGTTKQIEQSTDFPAQSTECTHQKHHPWEFLGAD